MVLTTKDQQKRKQSAAGESRADTPVTTSIKTNGEKKTNGHIKFNDEDEQDHENSGTSIGRLSDTTLQINYNGVVLENEEYEDEDEDDTPEAVSMGSGKNAAKKKEEDAQKAIEAQKDTTRQKRKRREAVLKEQKEAADARKRRKVVIENNSPYTATAELATEEKDTAPSDDEASTTLENRVAITKAKVPTLLAESLLEKISSLPSSPKTHKRAGDFGGDPGDEFGDDLGLADKVSLKKREKNRKRRLSKKAKIEFKKGPVSVKVLKNDKKSRKVMMPPANKKVVNTKNSWLAGRGTVKRRSVGSGIGRGNWVACSRTSALQLGQ